ncbi:LIM domain-binding protein 3-like [Gadus chalcogrammus]|uniref:LIM domain-binding protein 3-like n=1 Tax=Gadus chalcogrammus TaxID=1042646 RepID=UPI0024C320FA|nr:LIM domain-binding protein 3-like [Gadus chalcogrammus]
MNRQQELLSEAVRQYEHLYNPSLDGYKDTQMCSNSWDEIASNMGMPVGVCVNKWKSIRDKYVREKKAMQSRSGDAGGKGVSPWFISLSWLGVHIKHRATCSNYDKPSTASNASSPSTSSPANFQPSISSQAASLQPSISSQAASLQPSISSQAASLQPSISSQAASLQPSISSQAASLQPSISSQAASLQPSISSQAASLQPSISSQAASLQPSTSSSSEASLEPSSPEAFFEATALPRPNLPAFSPSTPSASMMSPSPPSHTGRKRKRRGQLDDFMSERVADLEERRQTVLSLESMVAPDEYARFGQVVGDLARTALQESRHPLMMRILQCLISAQGVENLRECP